ncbi:MAG: DUF4957 domain-containing protein [Prevotella sp.]|nr:DUF4957 domain-containing protein [Prevotella sp.]
MKFNKILTFCLIGLTIGATTSCKDHQEDEVTKLQLSRTLSPLNIEVSSISEAGAEVTWETSDKVSYYNFEVYADDHLTFKTDHRIASQCRRVLANELPLNLTNLDFDTEYSIRVQAVTIGEEDKSSKWSDYNFTTSFLKLLKAVEAENVTTNSVKLEWDVDKVAGRATKIRIGGKDYELSSENIENGNVIIGGLNSETTYTAQFLNASNKRLGNRTFTTDINTEGMTVLNETDDLKSILSSAADGQVFALNPGIYAGGDNIDIKTNVIIKGVKPMDMPIVEHCFTFTETARTSLTATWLKLDCTSSSTARCLLTTTAARDYAIKFQNCEIKGYGRNMIYCGDLPGSDVATCDEITYDNCLIYDIPCNNAAFIDLRKGVYVKKISFTNSTIYNSITSGRDVFRLDGIADRGTAVTSPIPVIIDHCTWANVGTNGGNYQIFYLRLVPYKVTFTNNIVTGYVNKRGFTQGVSIKDGDTTIGWESDENPTLLNNFYYQTKYLLKDVDGNDQKPRWFDTGGQELNPKFKNAAEYNFTLDNNTIIQAGAGDPRWLEAE